MALLHRFTQLNDRYGTGIFTFIVTKSVVRDPHRDATTKDFIYGYHRWALTFTRANEKALGVYLILRNPTSTSKCYADYSFTLLNKEHFSRNEIVSDKQVLFNSQHPAQGIGKWVLLSDIPARKFSDESGEFLLELSLSNILTIFEVDYTVPNIQTLQRNFKIETQAIQYGNFDWNLCVKPHESEINNEEFVEFGEQTTVNVFLNRLTGHDRLVRVKYRLFLGNGKRKEDSGVLDQISDGDGRIVGTQVNLFNLIEIAKANKNVIRFSFEMYCANLISEAKVGIVREQAPVINCYDRNKQPWSIEADFEKDHLRLKLFFMELDSVPKNHLRFISFNMYVVTKNTRDDTRESINVLNGPHSNYYITDKLDVGVTMDTDIESQAILKVSPKDYLTEDSYLTVHIEWIDSILLFNEKYNKYDDLARIHCHQMRREILALNAENDRMGRQFYSYQKSISGVNPRNTPQPNVAMHHQYSAGYPPSIGGSNNGNTMQHRVSDPYILDNLTAPFNSLIKTGSHHQIVSSSSQPSQSPSHHSKSHQPHPAAQQAQQQQIKTGTPPQPMHQAGHQAQQPNQPPTHHPSQLQQSQFHPAHQLHSTGVSQQTPTHLAKSAPPTAPLSNLQAQPQQPQQQQQQQQQMHQQPSGQAQINPLNSSIANMSLQNTMQQNTGYAGVQTNNSPTLPNTMQQHYQQQQMNQMNQTGQMPMNWQQQQQQQQNISNPLLQQQQQHLSSVNRSTGHPLPMNPTTTSINPIFNYNANQQMISSQASNMNQQQQQQMNQMQNEMLNTGNQLSAGNAQLNRHLSNSSCNLNASTYGGTNLSGNLTNTTSTNAGGLPASAVNMMSNINKPISSSNHNLNNLNQAQGMMQQYAQNGQNAAGTMQQQRYQHNMNTGQAVHQLPTAYRSPAMSQQMMPRNMNYEDQRMYLQQQTSIPQQPKSPLYNTNDMNYS